MDDHLVRALARDTGVRGLACLVTQAAREAGYRHQTSPIATAALGHGLAAAALLGTVLKVQQRIALKVEGNGPLRKMIVESDSNGRLRGYVSVPDLPSPLSIERGEVGWAFGHQGALTVVKDLRLKNLCQSVTPIRGDPLDAEPVRYLNQSEQIPSVVEIGVHVSPAGELIAAGDLLFQLIPGQGV